MIRFNPLAGVAGAFVMGLAGAAHAVTVETTDFIGTPTYFNDFEDIDEDPAYSSIFFPRNDAYTQGGITVEYVQPGSSDLVCTTAFQRVGQHGWYPAAGGNGFTRVTLSNGLDFSAIQFLSGSGFGGGGVVSSYAALLDGVVVASGDLGLVDSETFRFYGLSGGGFDEVRLITTRGGGYVEGVFEVGTFDNFAANAVPAPGGGGVPEPATWALMIMGMGGAGVALRRRRSVSATA